MALTKDDIDAVSMMLRVDGEPAFMILLTRGGLTKRSGSSDATDEAPVMITGRTDSCFEDFMAVLPEAVLQSEGAFEDEGREGPRHDWRFELGGGVNSLVYDIAYYSGSANLPDEFADMVVVAERLTHSWYVAGVADETGAAPVQVEAPPAPKPQGPARGTPENATAGRARGTGTVLGRAGPPLPTKRERIALAILLDLFAFTIPWSFVQWLFVGGDERVGPPGAGLVLFAIVEFVLLQIARRSPGYWLLGISADLGEKPRVDPSWPARESPATLAVGIAMCGLGVGGLTSWTAYHTAVPYFGLGFPLWLSLPLTLIGSLGLVLAGVLVLRLDLRGVWLGAGIGLLLFLSGLAGWSEWSAFVDAAMADRSAQVGRAVGGGPITGLIRGMMPLLVVGAPAALLAGVYESWRRLGRSPVPDARATPATS